MVGQAAQGWRNDHGFDTILDCQRVAALKRSPVSFTTSGRFDGESATIGTRESVSSLSDDKRAVASSARRSRRFASSSANSATCFTFAEDEVVRAQRLSPRRR